MKDTEKKERQLSKAEEKRKEEFETMAAKLSDEGYTQKLIEIGKVEMNTMVFVTALPIIIPLLILYFVFVNDWSVGAIDLFIAIVIFFASIVIHEVLHGVVWMIFAKNKWRSIAFGFIKETATPYCNCKEPLKKYQIILGTLTPALILGVGLGIVAIICGSMMLLVAAFLNIFACGGDLLIIIKLLLYKSDATSVLFIDHPYEIGTAIFEKRE